MPEGPELPEVHHLTADEHHHDAYGRRIAIATVLTTLAAALIAFLQAGALRAHDEADARAEKLGAIAVTQAAGQRDISQLQVDRFQIYQDDLARASNAESIATYGGGPGAKARLEAARWNRAAKVTNADTARMARDDGVPTITRTNVFGPDQDPRYPNRYFERGQHASYVLFAQRQGANERADAAESRFVHYAASLTMFAVAVFLLGYSLTPQGRPRRRLFSRVAGSFVVVAAIWGLVNVLNALPKAEPEAATAFADGKVALNTLDYAGAVRDFNVALAHQPGFVEAHVQRGTAAFAAGQPLPNEASIPPIAALERAAADERKALDLGSESPSVIGDLGSVLLYLGLRKHDDGILRESIHHSEEAAKRLPDDEGPAYNVAEARLALGDIEEARKDFAAAEQRTERRAPPSREGQVASVLTDFALIRQVKPDRSKEIDDLSNELETRASVGSVTADDHASAPQVALRRPTFPKMHVALDPGHAEVVVDQAQGFDPARDRVSQQWYQRDPKTGDLTVLAGISGPIVGGAGDSFGSTPYLSNPSYLSLSAQPACLPEGHYRVDLYANGHFAGRAEGNSDWHGLRPVQIRDLRVAFCIPSGLKAANPGSGTAADVFVAPGGKTGVVVFALPREVVAGHSTSALMNVVVKSFGSGSGVLPGLRQTSDAFNIFMNFTSPRFQRWTYNGGSLNAGGGVSPQGRLYIGIAWGPGDGALQTQIINSFSQLG
jgi:tetratricopeptide (TPR) repeat protein